MADSTGTVHAQYEYDPFGNRTKLSGDANFEADFGFTGYWHHGPSGLDFSLSRPYTSTLGRWISRDPLENAEMRQGTNLYSYVRNNSVNLTDPLGLYTAEEIQQALNGAYSGLNLRRNEVRALQQGNIALWKELQASRVVIGLADGSIGRPANRRILYHGAGGSCSGTVMHPGTLMSFKRYTNCCGRKLIFVGSKVSNLTTK